MKIENQISQTSRAEPVGGARGAANRSIVEPTPPVTRTDRVRISDEGRMLAAQGNAEGGLSAERLTQLRQRVADGTYGSAAVAELVARRIIESGDL
jgi:anti-sigma28 factor (negative regulator of flagellin synthesis)